jgi:hypothetical protein
LRWFWDKSGLILLGLVIVRGFPSQQIVHVVLVEDVPSFVGRQSWG